MPSLQLRQEFPTLKAFKEALHAWAIEAHFEPRILKSDTGRVRVGCKRDPNCPFVIRCNWERKNGREPLARVTVLKDQHTCLNAVEWASAPYAAMGGPMVPNSAMGGGGMNAQVEIRQDEDGNIIPGARVLGPVDRQGNPTEPAPLPVLPKVQRNSASRLPFLMEILPKLMNVGKETTPMEIRECLLREYGAEVHLQQCRRAKTEILKKREQGPPDTQVQQQQQQQVQNGHTHIQRLDTVSSRRTTSLDTGSERSNETPSHLYGDMNGNANTNTSRSNATPTNQNSHAFPLHAANGVVAPLVPSKSTAALREVGEQPVKCPYCINSRWMTSIKDAVEHMSMHVVV